MMSDDGDPTGRRSPPAYALEKRASDDEFVLVETDNKPFESVEEVIVSGLSPLEFAQLTVETSDMHFAAVVSPKSLSLQSFEEDAFLPAPEVEPEPDVRSLASSASLEDRSEPAVLSIQSPVSLSSNNAANHEIVLVEMGEQLVLESDQEQVHTDTVI